MSASGRPGPPRRRAAGRRTRSSGSCTAAAGARRRRVRGQTGPRRGVRSAAPRGAAVPESADPDRDLDARRIAGRLPPPGASRIDARDVCRPRGGGWDPRASSWCDASTSPGRRTTWRSCSRWSTRRWAGRRCSAFWRAGARRRPSGASALLSPRSDHLSEPPAGSAPLRGSRLARAGGRTAGRRESAGGRGSRRSRVVGLDRPRRSWRRDAGPVEEGRERRSRHGRGGRASPPLTSD